MADLTGERFQGAESWSYSKWDVYSNPSLTTQIFSEIFIFGVIALVANDGDVQIYVVIEKEDLAQHHFLPSLPLHEVLTEFRDYVFYFYSQGLLPKAYSS